MRRTVALMISQCGEADSSCGRGVAGLVNVACNGFAGALVKGGGIAALKAVLGRKKLPDAVREDALMALCFLVEAKRNGCDHAELAPVFVEALRWRGSLAVRRAAAAGVQALAVNNASSCGWGPSARCCCGARATRQRRSRRARSRR